MRNPIASSVAVSATDAPVELHYWPIEDIDAGRFTVALCGVTAVPVKGGHASTVGTSYTCPDCMLRYSLLGGGSNA